MSPLAGPINSGVADGVDDAHLDTRDGLAGLTATMMAAASSDLQLSDVHLEAVNNEMLMDVIVR